MIAQLQGYVVCADLQRYLQCKACSVATVFEKVVQQVGQCIRQQVGSRPAPMHRLAPGSAVALGDPQKWGHKTPAPPAARSAG